MGQTRQKNADGYWYPLTPLAGVLTGAHSGGWLFPLFHHSACQTNDTFSTRVLLLGYNAFSRHDWKEGNRQTKSCGFSPFFSHTVDISASHNPKSGKANAETNRRDRQWLVCYAHERHATAVSLTNVACAVQAPHNTPSEDVGLRSVSHGLFPFWRHETAVKTRLDGTPLNFRDESSLLLALFDTRHDTVAAKDGKEEALDYKRRRVLWRLWHYEKRNGDVSVDIFPGITYDTRADGFSKTSLLWRLYRYERHPGGGVDLDLLFLPLSRAR